MCVRGVGRSLLGRWIDCFHPLPSLLNQTHLSTPQHDNTTVYVDAPKVTDTYSGIRLSTAVGEQNYIKGNPKFFAVSLAVSEVK